MGHYIYITPWGVILYIAGCHQIRASNAPQLWTRPLRVTRWPRLRGVCRSPAAVPAGVSLLLGASQLCLWCRGVQDWLQLHRQSHRALQCAQQGQHRQDARTCAARPAAREGQAGVAPSRQTAPRFADGWQGTKELQGLTKEKGDIHRFKSGSHDFGPNELFFPFAGR